MLGWIMLCYGTAIEDDMRVGDGDRHIFVLTARADSQPRRTKPIVMRANTDVPFRLALGGKRLATPVLGPKGQLDPCQER